MVDRQQIKPLSGTVTVVDLDGTLIRGNTLHIYIRCGMRRFLRQRRYGTLARTLLYLAGRKMRFITHRRMKFGILALIKPDEELKKDFVSRVSRAKRTWLVDELERRSNDGATILLATAAADVYVPWIWDGAYVATPSESNPDHTECRGSYKRKLVERYAAENHLRITTVISDHTDDLSLLSIPSSERILVKPSPALCTALTMADLPYTVRND